MVWDNTASQWEPGTVAGGTSSIQTATDFELQPGTFPYWGTKEGSGTPSAGEWFANGSNVMRANPVDSNGTDWTTEMTALGTTGTFWYSTNSINWTQTTNTGGQDNLPTWFQFGLAPFNANSHTGGIYISFSDPASASGTPLQNNDILQWVSADSAFKPVQLPAAVSSIQTATDFELQPATGTAPITRTGASQSSNVTSGNVGLSIQGSGFTYWSTNPDGLSGTILDYLVNTATFPIDVDISGTTYTITGIDDDSASGTPNVRLDHSAGVSFSNGVSYTLSLAAAPTQALQNNDILQWVDADSKFKPVQLPAAVSSIDDLSDVDTTTAAPTDGQALLWDNANSQWEPGTIASSSSIQTATDFDLNPAGSQRTWIYTASSDSNPASGVISNWTGTAWMVNITDNNGDDASAMQSASGTLGITVYVDGVLTYTGTTISSGWANQNGTRAGFQFTDDSWKSSLTGGEEITLDMAIFSTGDTPLADGDILQWVGVDSKFKPVQQTGSSIRTLLGIGEYVDDTAAGTGGVASGALYYNTTTSDYKAKT